MNEPTLYKPTWTVWTNEAVDRGSGFPATTHPRWMWTAHGPRGSQSGCEATADAAVLKAQCAMHVLSDPERGQS